jgi:hypothetical protein
VGNLGVSSKWIFRLTSDLKSVHRNWEGGYFRVHGDGDGQEEWMDEDDIAENRGALEKD